MDSKIENNRIENRNYRNDRKPGRPKGQPKSGGRQAGSVNKVTALASIKFREACEQNDFDFGCELIGSLKMRDLDYAKVLISIMDYYFGKVPVQKVDDESNKEDDLNINVNLNSIFK